MNKIRNIAAACAVLCLMGPEAMSQGIVHDRVVRRNAGNGITASRRTAFRGRNGGVGVRGRSARTDGHGNVTRIDGGAYRAADGATAGRKSTTTRASDGSADRQSSASASGPQGSLQTSASSQRNADGGAASTRNTNVTAGNGNTYQGSTTWTKGSGVQHTGTCKDASGTVITCRGQ